jgi:hypothetical protein
MGIEESISEFHSVKISALKWAGSKLSKCSIISLYHFSHNSVKDIDQSDTKIQVNVGPRTPPFTGISDKPPVKRSMSFSDLQNGQALVRALWMNLLRSILIPYL